MSLIYQYYGSDIKEFDDDIGLSTAESVATLKVNSNNSNLEQSVISLGVTHQYDSSDCSLKLGFKHLNTILAEDVRISRLFLFEAAKRQILLTTGRKQVITEGVGVGMPNILVKDYSNLTKIFINAVPFDVVYIENSQHYMSLRIDKVSQQSLEIDNQIIAANIYYHAITAQQMLLIEEIRGKDKK